MASRGITSNNFVGSMAFTLSDLQLLRQGNHKTLARAITLVENDIEGSSFILRNLTGRPGRVWGITGPPGAGKSSLVNEIASKWAKDGKKVAILAVDPTSPFNYGSLLGDRLRMPGLFTMPGVFIRSLATRGNLGGLSAKMIEVADVVREAGFDEIIIETVGVGQSEVEIAGVADYTCVVLVPEAGDEIQTLKSGIMEIASLFVVNKCDREGAEAFAGFIKSMLHQRDLDQSIPVHLVSATQHKGLTELLVSMEKLDGMQVLSSKKLQLLADRVRILVSKHKMQSFPQEKMMEALKVEMNKPGFNLYLFSEQWF